MGVLGGGWTMESGGGQGRGGWIKESVNLVSVGGWVCVCVGVLSVGLGPGLDSMSPARSRRSASHAAGTHGWLPKKTGRPGLRRGGVGGYNLHSVPPNSPPDCGTVAHQPRAGCIRLVQRNLIILQVNINGLRNKLEELKLLIHDTHADIITIQETKLTPKAKTPKIHNFTSVRTDRLHKAGGGLITLIRDNITFTTTDIPSTINTHNIELQMVKVHINNTKHITIANIYIPPRDTTSTHYKTADTDIQHCIQYITNIPHSVLTGDVNAHSTLWHSYTDDHRGQLIADVISNSDHITLNTKHPNQSAKHHTTTNIITRHHHGV